MRYIHPNKYYIDNKKFSNIGDYFYELIRIIRLKDFPEGYFPKNITTANTRLKILRDSIFRNFDSENTFQKKKDEEFNLFFESQDNISIQLLKYLIKKQGIKTYENRLIEYEKKIKNFEGELRVLNEKLTETIVYFKDIVSWRKKHSIYTKKISRINNLIEKYNKISLNRAKPKLNAINLIFLKNEINELLDRKNNINIKIKELKTKARNAKEQYDALTDDLDRADFLKHIIRERTCFCELDLFENIAEQIITTKLCPICKRKMVFNQKDEIINIQKKIQEQKKNYNTYQTKIKRLEEEVINIQKRLEKLKNISKKEELEHLNNGIEENNVKILHVIDQRLRSFENFNSFFGIHIKNSDRVRHLKRKIKIIKLKIDKKKKLYNYNLEKKNYYESFLNFLEEDLSNNTTIGENLKIEFDDIQDNLIRSKFISNQNIVIVKHKSFKEIEIISDLPVNILHLNYFLSLLKLKLNYLSKSNTFKSFPLFYLDDTQGNIDLNLLSKIIDILISFKKIGEFQVFISSPNFNHSNLKKFKDLIITFNLIIRNKKISEWI